MAQTNPTVSTWFALAQDVDQSAFLTWAQQVEVGLLTVDTTNFNVYGGSGTMAAAVQANRSVALGHQALAANVNGRGFVAIGYRALASWNDPAVSEPSAAGGFNTAVGEEVFTDLTTGQLNTGVGTHAGFHLEGAASSNTFIGVNCGFGTFYLTASITGSLNALVGYQVMEWIETGNSNSGIGSSGLNRLRTGDGNCFVGHQVLKLIETASFNIGIGYLVATTQVSGNSNIYIGDRLEPQSTTQANTLNIGNVIFGTSIGLTIGTVVSTAGRIGIRDAAPDAALTVNGQISVAAGSAAAPSLAARGDLDTGMFFPAAGVIHWSINSVYKLRLDATGVGIGGITPLFPLHITGNLAAGQGPVYIQELTAAGAGAGVTLANQDASNVWTFLATNTGAGVGNNFFSVFEGGATQKYWVQIKGGAAGGMFGVAPGTSGWVPLTKFHVEHVAAGTNDVVTVGRFSRVTSGSPAAGIGARVDFSVQTGASTFNMTVGAAMDVVATDLTGASEDFAYKLSLMAGGTLAQRLEVLSLGHLTLGDPGIRTTVFSSINGASYLFNGVGDGTSSDVRTNFVIHNGSTQTPRLILSKGRGGNSFGIVNSGDQLGVIRFQGDDGVALRTGAEIIAQIDGTPAASDMPTRLTFWTNPDGTITPKERVRIDNAGSVIIGDSAAALATSATGGFLYIPTCAGPPSGTPTAATGTVPLIYDSTNNQLYIYSSGWKQPKTPAAAVTVTWQ